MILLGIIAGIICALMLNKVKEHADKAVIKKRKSINMFINILIVACNTILYCVLYNKLNIGEVKDIVVSENMVRYFGCFTIHLALITSLIYMGIRDALEHRITNKFLIFLVVLGMLNVSFKIILYKDLYQLLILLVEIVIIFISLSSVRYISKLALGGGDIKFISILPMFYNYYEIMTIMLVASLMALVYGMWLMVFKKKTVRYEMAYGFFLSVSSILIIVLK